MLKAAGRAGLAMVDVVALALRIGLEEMQAAAYNLEYLELNQKARNLLLSQLLARQHAMDPDPLPLGVSLNLGRSGHFPRVMRLECRAC